MSALEAFLSDRSLIDAVHAPANRLIMVIGGVDSGKTTLVESIVRALLGSCDLGIADLDVGQSHIGPPTTVSWGRPPEEFQGWDGVKIEDMYFTGTLSPEGNLLPCLAGAKIITDRALLSCDRVVADTSGFISSPPAIVLKTYKLDLLSPDIVIGLEKNGELEDICGPFSTHRSMSIYRVPVPRHIRPKTMETRSRYRYEKFSAYFADALTHEVSLQSYPVRFTRLPADLSPQGLEKRIVSFRDGMNRDRAIGIIEKADSREGKLLIKSPLKNLEGVATLLIGSALSPL